MLALVRCHFVIENRFAGISLVVKILIRNSRFDKANDAINCILVYI